MTHRFWFAGAILAAVALTGSIFSGRATGSQIAPSTAFNGGYLPLEADGNDRSIAVGEYFRLYVVGPTGANSVRIFDLLTARDRGSVALTGVSSGTVAVSQIAVAHDGAIYITNLTDGATAAAPFRIYRYADHAALNANDFTVAYSGVPLAGQRFGDSIDVRGSGADTQIIAGGGSGSNSVAVFSTADGHNFSAAGYALPGAANAANRVAFGAGNTLYTKQVGADLKLFSFASDGTLTLLHDFPSGGATTAMGRIGPIDVDPVTGLLAGLSFSSDPASADTVRLYDISNTSVPPAEQGFPQHIRMSEAENPDFAGSLVFISNRLWVLDTNHGIAGYFISVPEPATLGLIGLSALGFLARRRRN